MQLRRSGVLLPLAVALVMGMLLATTAYALATDGAPQVSSAVADHSGVRNVSVDEVCEVEAAILPISATAQAGAADQPAKDVQFTIVGTDRAKVRAACGIAKEKIRVEFNARPQTCWTATMPQDFDFDKYTGPQVTSTGVADQTVELFRDRDTGRLTIKVCGRIFGDFVSVTIGFKLAD